MSHIHPCTLNSFNQVQRYLNPNIFPHFVVKVTITFAVDATGPPCIQDTKWPMPFSSVAPATSDILYEEVPFYGQ